MARDGSTLVRPAASRPLVVPWALFAACLAGCQPNYGTVPVQGRVTFAGKAPPAFCSVIFAPTVADQKLRPGVARCDSNGNFRATSYNPRDGLLPGRYRARVRCISGGTETEPPTNHVPPDFEPPEFEVPAKPANPVVVDIDVR